MTNKKCKLCKRFGEKFFTRGDKCSTVKCGALKTPARGKGRGKRKKQSSEYGAQLNEKQKMKIVYLLREKQFKNYVLKAVNKKGADPSEHLVRLLETRLDNAVYRLGFAASRGAARQMTGHGHILVNEKKINVPSYGLKTGDKISIKENSKNKKIFGDLDIVLKKYNPPAWLELNKEKKEGKIVAPPGPDENEFKINTTAIIEFYMK